MVTRRAAFWLTFCACAAGCGEAEFPKGDSCPMRTQAGAQRGYEVEWTRLESEASYDRVCSDRYPGLMQFEVAVVRGTGKRHLGARLRRELEATPFDDIKLDGWSVKRACGYPHAFHVTLNAKKSGCRVDEAIALVGETLRKLDADDRIVLGVGLWAAPAI